MEIKNFVIFEQAEDLFAECMDSSIQGDILISAEASCYQVVPARFWGKRIVWKVALPTTECGHRRVHCHQYVSITPTIPYITAIVKM